MHEPKQLSSDKYSSARSSSWDIGGTQIGNDSPARTTCTNVSRSPFFGRPPLPESCSCTSCEHQTTIFFSSPNHNQSYQRLGTSRNSPAAPKDILRTFNMGDVANDEAVKLAMQLIDVESLSGHEQPMASVLKDWLEKRGWTVELQAVESQKGTVNGETRHNLYARRAGITSTEGPRVLFNSHMDTVGCNDQLRLPSSYVYCVALGCAQKLA